MGTWGQLYRVHLHEWRHSSTKDIPQNSTQVLPCQHTFSGHCSHKLELRHLRPPTNTQFLHEVFKISTVQQKKLKIHSEVVSPRRWLTGQTIDVAVTELRQLIPGMNVMWLLGVGDASLNQQVAAANSDNSENYLSSWVHRLDWHGQNHLPFKNHKSCMVKTSTEFHFSHSCYILLIYMLICTWSTWCHHWLQLDVPNPNFSMTQIVLSVKKCPLENQCTSLLVLSSFVILHSLLPALIMSGPLILIAPTVQ